MPSKPDLRKDKSKELAEAHWSYIEALLRKHKVPGDEIKVVGFHYISAFLHGFKHGRADQ